MSDDVKILYSRSKIILPDYVKERLENGVSPIRDDILYERYKRIKPIISCEGEKYFLDNLSLEDLRALSFLSKANSSEVIKMCPKVDLSTLKEIRDFICLHHYGFSLQFRPSVSEVLSQIPQDVVSYASAFEIVETPVLPRDLHTYTYKRYHLSRVMAYKIK